MGVVLEITSEEAKALKALRAVAAGMKEVEKGGDELVKKTRGATKEQQDLERAALNFLRNTKTPQEEHNRRLEGFNLLLKKGAMTQEEWTAATKKSQRAMEDAANARGSAFGDKAIQQIMGMAQSLGMAVGAVSLLKKGFDEVAEAKNRAAQAARESEVGMATLAQLTNDPKQYAKYVQKAKAIAGRGGAVNEDSEAARLVFLLASMGSFQDADFFASLRASGIVEKPDVIAGAADTLLKAMGKKETGTLRQIVSKGFAASEFTKAKVPELLAASARAGLSGSIIGLSDEEVLAATAIISGPTGDAEAAGTRMGGLASALAKIGAGGIGEGEGGLVDPHQSMKLRKRIRERTGGKDLQLKGKSLIEQVRSIEALGLDPAEIITLLGNKRALEGFVALKLNQEEYGRALKRVSEGNFADLATTRAELPKGIPSVNAARLARTEEAGLTEAAGEAGLGEEKLLREAISANFKRRMVQGKRKMFGFIGGNVGYAMGAAADWLSDLPVVGMPAEQYIWAAYRDKQLEGDPELKAATERYLRRKGYQGWMDSYGPQQVTNSSGEMISTLKTIESHLGEIKKNTAGTAKNTAGSPSRAAVEEPGTHGEKARPGRQSKVHPELN